MGGGPRSGPGAALQSPTGFGYPRLGGSGRQTTQRFGAGGELPDTTITALHSSISVSNLVSGLSSGATQLQPDAQVRLFQRETADVGFRPGRRFGVERALHVVALVANHLADAHDESSQGLAGA